MKHYTGAVVERALKVQEVILRALARSLTWIEAAEIIGVSPRQMRRWYERYREFGYDGLYDRRRGKPSPRRVPIETVQEVLRLYQEEYFDFNVRHFHEKLTEKHQIELKHFRKRDWSRSGRSEGHTDGAGIVGRCLGCCCTLMEASIRWFQDERYYDLITIMDDATSEVYYSQVFGRGVNQYGDAWSPGSDRETWSLLCALQ